MSTELYIKTLPSRIQNLQTAIADKLFRKWAFNYQVQTRAVHQYSQEIFILLQKYSLYLIYCIYTSHPQLQSTIYKFFIDNRVDTNNATKITNFDPEQICVYEDFTNFIAKIYEAAETDFKDKILQYRDFSHYLQLIVAFKLIVDLLDLVEIWKEKDEGLKKFQNLCKFRVVQIIREKKNYENSPEYKECEQELNNLDEQIKQENIQEEQNKKMLAKQQEEQRNQIARTQTLKTENKMQNLFGISRTSTFNTNNNNLKFGKFANPYAQPKKNNINPQIQIKKNPSKKKVAFGQNDREAQEITQMYMNYQPGDMQNNNIQDNSPKTMKQQIDELLKNYEFKNEVKIIENPVPYKSVDFYKLKIYIKSILIPKITTELGKNQNTEAYHDSQSLLYYLSIMNPK